MLSRKICNYLDSLSPIREKVKIQDGDLCLKLDPIQQRVSIKCSTLRSAEIIQALSNIQKYFPVTSLKLKDYLLDGILLRGINVKRLIFSKLSTLNRSLTVFLNSSDNGQVEEISMEPVQLISEIVEDVLFRSRHRRIRTLRYFNLPVSISNLHLIMRIFPKCREVSLINALNQNLAGYLANYPRLKVRLFEKSSPPMNILQCRQIISVKIFPS